MHNHPCLPALRRPAAGILAAATLLFLLALAHHPGATVHPATAHDALAYIDSLSAPLAAMHGAVIALYGAVVGCTAVFAATLGMRRPPVLLAMAAYLAGFALLCGAALLDGFVTPQLAHLYLAASETRALQVNVTLAAISVGIQVLSRAGLLALSLALVAFSCALVPHRRSLAAIALLAGVLPAIFMLMNGLWLGPSNLAALFAPQAVWQIAMAWALYDKPATRALLQADRSTV